MYFVKKSYPQKGWTWFGRWGTIKEYRLEARINDRNQGRS